MIAGHDSDRSLSCMGMRCFPTVISARTNNFGLIRLSLAILVVFSHSFPLTTGNSFSEPLKRLTGTMSFGDGAVDCFFILSGFLISHSFVRSSSATDFIRKRALRIYPAFIVVCLLGVLGVGYIGSEFEPGYYRHISVWKFATCLLFLWNYQVGPLFVHVPFVGCANGPLWTIPMEFMSYLLVAAMGLTKLLGRRRVVALFFVVMFITYAIQLPTKPTHGPANEWPRFLTCFGAGMWFYCNRSRIPHNTMIVLGCVAILLVTSLTRFGLQLALPLCGSYLLFAAAFGKKVRLMGLGDEIDLSYGVYLYAYPLQQLTMMFAGRPVAPMLLFAGVMPPLLACASASWFWVEKPFLRKKSKPDDCLLPLHHSVIEPTLAAMA